MKFKVNSENRQADHTLNHLKLHGVHALYRPGYTFQTLHWCGCYYSVSEHFTLYTLNCLADAVDRKMEQNKTCLYLEHQVNSLQVQTGSAVIVCVYLRVLELNFYLDSVCIIVHHGVVSSIFTASLQLHGPYFIPELTVRVESCSLQVLLFPPTCHFQFCQ